MGRPAELPPNPYRLLLQQAEAFAAKRRDPRAWIEENLFIRTKARRVIPLLFNSAQTDYYEYRSTRDIILKPRQLGFTTLVEALFFTDVLLHPNTTSMMIAHDMPSAEQLFGIGQLFVTRLPASEQRRVGKPQYANRREFYWPKLNSRFLVGTAGAALFGRGFTINNLHCSEFAFWPNPEEALAAALEAVPEEGRVVIESTANGLGNYFHDLWTEVVEGRGRYRGHFYTWWEDPSYAIVGPPLTDLSEEERVLMQKYGLSHHQIRWRRAKQGDLREKWAQEYPEDPVSCFLASGRCVFDTKALARLAAALTGDRGRSMVAIPRREGVAVPVPPATLRVWKQPERERHYVVGGDVGEGLEGGDASCGIVLDRETGEQVAELHGRVSPDRFGHLLAALGWWYNRAEMGVERNGHGHSTLNTLRNTCRYPYLYYHVAYDARVGKPAEAQLGWPTTSATKPILVDDLAEAINSGAMRVRSVSLVNECFTFIVTDSGSAEAQAGKFDDRVIAAGIAWQVRKRPRSRGIAERPAGM